MKEDRAHIKVSEHPHEQEIPAAYSPTQLGVVADPLVQLSAQLARDSEPYARVKIPDPDELEVRLVDISQLQRLDELRSDVTLMQSLLFTMAGALLGFIVNIATSSQTLDKDGWVILGFFLGATVIFVWLTLRASKRASYLRQKLFDNMSV